MTASRKNLARGSINRHGRLFAAANIEAETHAALLSHAQRDGVSVARSVRRLVTIGLQEIDGIPAPRGQLFTAASKQRLARGRRLADGRIQIAAQFTPELFNAIRQRAMRKNTSVSEQIGLLLEWGLGAEDGQDGRRRSAAA